jgi:hypothetical protein
MSDQQQEAKRYPIKQSATMAGGAAVTMALVDLFAHMGPTGLLVSGLAGYVAWRHGPEIYEQVEQQVRGFIPSHPKAQEPEGDQAKPAARSKGRSFWDRALGHFPDQAEPGNDEQAIGDQAAQPEPGNGIDQLFQTAAQNAEAAPSVERFHCNDIIRNTPQDSYQLCIGRSLTRRGNPPIWINFYCQHLKLIGASQYGKSSMAAAILYLITRTHSPDNVLLALLDMEHKTSKLFTDCPHLAAVNINGTRVALHAKTREQVLEHLGYIVEVMGQRYALSEEEAEQEPILLVYLEEFLALKDYFKRLTQSTTGEACERAKKDYNQLVFNVSEIARRGLKVKVQFLMCAQVDYRDDDFVEALINVTAGLAFCVKPTAAAAAGFFAADLLRRNVEDDKKGQFVAETPDAKDLVLAPEYNLKKKLLAYEQEHQGARPARPKEQRASILAPASTADQSDQDQAPPHQPEPAARNQDDRQASMSQQDQNQRKLTSLHRQALEHYRPGLGLRKLGELIGVGKDKAGDLKQDLIKWGFLKDDGANE